MILTEQEYPKCGKEVEMLILSEFKIFFFLYQVLFSVCKTPPWIWWRCPKSDWKCSSHMRLSSTSLCVLSSPLAEVYGFPLCLSYQRHLMSVLDQTDYSTFCTMIVALLCKACDPCAAPGIKCSKIKYLLGAAHLWFIWTDEAFSPA